MSSRLAGRAVISPVVVPALLLCCFCVRADPGWQLSGKDPGTDRRVAALLTQLEESRTLALGKVSRELGLSPGKLPVRWVLRLESSPPPLPAEAGWTEAGEKEVVVTLPAWRYLEYPAKARRVVVHEAVHAVMASRFGAGGAYRALPRWFREGTALLVSGEGTARVHGRIVTTILAGGRPGSFLSGVYCGKPPSPAAGCRLFPAEGYLAVCWLEGRLGRPGLRDLLSRLAAGGAFEDEVRAFTGLEPGGMEKAVLSYCAERISRLASKGCERLLARALALCRSGDHGRARDILNSIRNLPGNIALKDTIVFLHSRTLVEDGFHRQAAAALEGLLKEEYEVPWEPEIFEQLGRCRRALGAPLEARQTWKTVAERFPHDREIQGRIALLLKARNAVGE